MRIAKSSQKMAYGFICWSVKITILLCLIWHAQTMHVSLLRKYIQYISNRWRFSFTEISTGNLLGCEKEMEDSSGNHKII